MTRTTVDEVTPFDAAEYLDDGESIAAFLNASHEMNDPAVLLNALSTVARARSMTALAEASGLGRESLYKALRPGAHPRYETVMRVMDALGVEMVFQPKGRAQEKAAGKAPRDGSHATERAVSTGRRVATEKRKADARASAKDKATPHPRQSATRAR
jgi:probable addiction module antidote protein